MKDKQTNHTSEEVIQSLGETFGVDTGKEGWQGQDIRVKSTPLVDPGQGEAVVIRSFVFHKNPVWKGRLPNQQDIFNMHWRQIRNMLWADGLVANQDIQPRMEIGSEKYIIFVTCSPKLRANGIREVVGEKLRNLKDYLSPKSLTK